jgi:hypothetical protein
MRSLNANFGFEPRKAILVNANLAMAGYSDNQFRTVQKRMISDGNDSWRRASGFGK